MRKNTQLIGKNSDTRLSQKGVLIAVLMAVAVCVLVTFASVHRFTSYNAGLLDIGYMSQAIWSASNGDLLLVSSQNGVFSRIMGHSEFIYFPIALLYKLFPTPITLLVLQSILFALGAIPVYLLSINKLDNVKHSLLLTGVYLFYPVAMTAVLFDFHGDTLAMPLLIFAIYNWDRKRPFIYGMTLFLALTCKIYVALPVVIFGIVLFIKGYKKDGLIALSLAILWLVFLFFFRKFTFGGSIASEATRQISGYTNNYYKDLISGIIQDLDYRVISLIVVIAPILFLGWKKIVWLLPAAGIIGSVVISTGPGPVYDYRFHHYALAVPFLLIAIVFDASDRQRGIDFKLKSIRLLKNRTWQRDIHATFLITLILNLFTVQTPLSVLYYLFPYLGSEEVPVSSRDYRDQVKDYITKEIVPEDAGVLADLFLGPHLANRSQLYSTYYSDATTDEEGFSDRQLETIFSGIDIAVVDFYSTYYSQQITEMIVADDSFDVIYGDSGIVVFSKEQGQSQVWQNEYSIALAESGAGYEDLVRAGGAALSIKPLDDDQYIWDFSWIIPERGINPDTVLVTTIDGLEHYKILHTPFLKAINDPKWVSGNIYSERFTVKILKEFTNAEYSFITELYKTAPPGSSLFSEDREAGTRVISGVIKMD